MCEKVNKCVEKTFKCVKKTSKPTEFAFNFAKTVLKPAEIKLK